MCVPLIGSGSYHFISSDVLGKCLLLVPVTSTSADLEVLVPDKGILLGGDKANIP